MASDGYGCTAYNIGGTKEKGGCRHLLRYASVGKVMGCMALHTRNTKGLAACGRSPVDCTRMLAVPFSKRSPLTTQNERILLLKNFVQEDTISTTKIQTIAIAQSHFVQMVQLWHAGPLHEDGREQLVGTRAADHRHRHGISIKQRTSVPGVREDKTARFD